MHSRSARLKRAVYEEIKACKTDAERRELARYFVSPPCTAVCIPTANCNGSQMDTDKRHLVLEDGHRHTE